jgi:hypothetical protein
VQPPETRRRFPRADLRVKARLSLSRDPKRQFEATLPTADISVGGIFFESSFLLKLGMQLDVSLELPPSARPVRARGSVVRVETMQADGKGKTGFAIKFSEYLDNSEVVLANYFLAPVLREFIQGYAKKNRFRASAEYLAHSADLLSAWELKKAEDGGMRGWDEPRPASRPASPTAVGAGRPGVRAFAPPPSRPSAPRGGRPAR